MAKCAAICISWSRRASMNGSVCSMSAPAFSFSSEAKAAGKSASTAACKIFSCIFSFCCRGNLGYRPLRGRGVGVHEQRDDSRLRNHLENQFEALGMKFDGEKADAGQIA